MQNSTRKNNRRCSVDWIPMAMVSSLPPTDRSRHSNAMGKGRSRNVMGNGHSRNAGRAASRMVFGWSRAR